MSCHRVFTGAVARYYASVEGLLELDGSWTGSVVAACYLLPSWYWVVSVAGSQLGRLVVAEGLAYCRWLAGLQRIAAMEP